MAKVRPTKHLVIIQKNYFALVLYVYQKESNKKCGNKVQKFGTRKVRFLK